MGADAGGICPVRSEVTWVDNKFTVLFQTKIDGFRRYRNPTVADLAFYQLLRPGPTGQESKPVKDLCPFPFRIMSELGVDM
jgi:hypothetical protein